MTEKKKLRLVESDDPSTDEVYVADCRKMTDTDLVEWFLFDAEDLIFTILKEIRDISRNRHETTFLFSLMATDLARMKTQREVMIERGKLKKIPQNFDEERVVWGDAEIKELSERDLYYAYLHTIHFLRNRYDLHYFRDSGHEREWYEKSSAAWKQIEKIHGELERRRENA